MTMPTLALTCHECGWRPAGDRTLGLMNAHVETEHPDAYAGPDQLHVDLAVFCPRDDTRLSDVEPRPLAGGRELLVYDCPTCHRTYSLTRDAT